MVIVFLLQFIINSLINSLQKSDFFPISLISEQHPQVLQILRMIEILV